MAQGGSRSMWFGSRRWIAAGFGLIVSLALTASSGPADFFAQAHSSSAIIPPAWRILPSKSVPIVLPKSMEVAPMVAAAPMTIPSTGALGAELVHDASNSPPAVPVNIPAAALVQRTHPRTLWVEVTAYCSCKKCCGPGARGITSSGKPITYNDGHFLAADLKLLPYGTRLIVPGYNNDIPVEVIDRGGAIRGYHIDIFMPTHEQAVEWGKKRLQVMVVE